MSGLLLQGAHVPHIPKAEVAARQLIHSWIRNGPKQLNHFEPDAFPTGPLQQVASGVLDAMLNEGVQDIAGLVAYFTDAPEGTRAELIECSEGFAPMPSDCGPLIQKLTEFDRTKRTQFLSWELNTPDGQENPRRAEIIRQLAEIEAGGGTAKLATIGSKLATREFDFSNQPPKPIPLLQLRGMPLSTAGNILNIQGPPKVGKSAVEDSMIAAIFTGRNHGPDTLGFSAENPQGRALLHFDTEQSRYDHDALVRRAVRRAGITTPPEWFHSYSLVDLDIYDRRQALRHVMNEAQEAHGGILAVMIDGIGDLCGDPNDSEESFGLVAELHTLATTYDCSIITVLHENPGSESGKTRGHLGSQLERKAETNLRLAKDAAGITTVWAERARHCYLPKEQGPCFEWNTEAEMHTSCGTAGEIKSASIREKMREESDRVFGGDDSTSFRHCELVKAIESALYLKEKSAKERIRKWYAEGIINKDASAKYHLINL